MKDACLYRNPSCRSQLLATEACGGRCTRPYKPSGRSVLILIQYSVDSITSAWSSRISTDSRTWTDRGGGSYFSEVYPHEVDAPHDCSGDIRVFSDNTSKKVKRSHLLAKLACRLYARYSVLEPGTDRRCVAFISTSDTVGQSFWPTKAITTIIFVSSPREFETARLYHPRTEFHTPGTAVPSPGAAFLRKCHPQSSAYPLSTPSLRR